MESHYVIAAEESSAPGRYSFAAYPFLREVFDSFADPDLDMVVTPKGGQVGWTTGFTGLIGALAATDPSRILVVLDTQTAAETWSTDRFMPNARATPALRKLFPKPKSRDGDNKILFKRYPGGALKTTWAGSPSGLSSWPPKRAFADEVDRYKLSVGAGSGSGGGEGDPIAQLRKRIQTWLRRGGKIGLGSTPKIEQTSIIWGYWLQGDQRKWLCPCPACGHEQDLRWEQVVWDKTEGGKHLPATARYECERCRARWSDLDRKLAVRKGRWQATAVAADPRVRSYHVAGLLSPHVSHAELATRWLGCKTDETRQAFVNLDLGLPWRIRGEAPKWEELLHRRDSWPADRVPAGALFLTAGVDVQKDRLEARVWGWGRNGKESWLVETVVLEGESDLAGTEIWDKLTALCGRTWRHESGAEMALARLAIDGKHAAERVYAWARRRSRQQVMVVNGDGSGAAILGVPKAAEVTRRGKAAKAGIRIWPVVSGRAKAFFYECLRLPKPTRPGEPYPPGYVHFNAEQATDDEVRQHVAEELVEERGKSGLGTLVWRLVAGRRNEGLDCRVYAHAAAVAFGLDRFTPRQWHEMEAAMQPERPAASAGPARDPAAPPGTRAPPRRPRRRSATSAFT